MKLIFVYNADSDIFSQIGDYVKKAITPSKYQCNLCMVTYSNTGMKKDWKEYIDNLEHEVIYLHRDEFNAKYPDSSEVDLPAIFTDVDNKIELFMSATQVNNQKSVSELINSIDKILENISGKS